MNTHPPDAYEAQLAARVTELLPDVTTADRLELLGVMDPDDMRTSLAWLISHAPQLFDSALVRDAAMVDRLENRLDEAQEENDEEPYCSVCGATTGIFHGHGDVWLHYTGEGTVQNPIELFDAGHEPVIAWRPVARMNARGEL